MKSKNKSSWKRIHDEKVHHIWECPECENTATVGPEWYQQNGTPVCPHCDCDMEYGHTEVRP
jgi:uncharacterized paraquat-inducible protein A